MEIYFLFVTSPRFFWLDFDPQGFVERQDAISPTIGVVLCKAALANHKGSKAANGLGWLKSTRIWCIKQVLKVFFRGTNPRKQRIRSNSDYLYTNDTVDDPEIQLNHHWKDVFKKVPI